MAGLFLKVLSEAYRKYKIFYRYYDNLFSQVEKAFTSQGPAAQRFWKLYMFQGDYFSKHIDEDVELRTRAIMELLALMEDLTFYSVRLLLDCKLFTLTELTERFAKSLIGLHSNKYKWLLARDRMELAWRFNNGVRSWRHPGRSFIINELPDLQIDDDGRVADIALFQKFLDQYIRCFDQLCRWLSEFCAEYEVPEGGFPYLPSSARRVHADGSTEKLLTDYCILAMDIIRSTDDEQTGNMKTAILEAIERYKQHNVFSEKTHNDAFVVCADNPQVLWDICCSIAMIGEQIRLDPARMAGTRKGLSMGSLVVTVDPNGLCMIRDAWAPHALPMAFSTLKGVDEYARKNRLDPNLLIIISDKALEDYIRPLRLKPLGTQFVEERHFVGTCHIVKLST